MAEIIPISQGTERDIKEFNLAFTEKLKQFRPKFREMKRKLLEGNDLSAGFGCLPPAHGDCTLGVATRLSQKDNTISYRAPSSFGLQIDVDLPNNEKWRIIDWPDITKNYPFVVSFYLKTDSHYPPTFVDTGILTVPEDVLVGVTAHELAELRIRFGSPLPLKIREKIGLYKAQGSKFNFEGVLPETEKEIEFDLAASMFGFKDQMIKLKEFLIGRLYGYNQTTQIGRGYEQHIIQEKFRKSVIESF